MGHIGSKPCQLRVGSIIPTTYNATVAVTRGFEHEQWLGKFKRVVDAQMRSLACPWDALSSSSIEIVHLSQLVDTEVSRLHRCGKDEVLCKKHHEINGPPVKTLIGEACAKEGRLGDAMVYHMWIVFPQSVYDELTSAQTKGHCTHGKNRIWVPCLEASILEWEQDKKRETRVGHDFKEWLVDTARPVGEEAFGKHEVDEKRLSSQDVIGRLSPDIITELRRKFGCKPDWAAQDACDNVCP